MHEPACFFVGDKADGSFCAKLALFSQGHRVYSAFREAAVDHWLLVWHKWRRDGGELSAQGGAELVIVTYPIFRDEVGIFNFVIIHNVQPSFQLYIAHGFHLVKAIADYNLEHLWFIYFLSFSFSFSSSSHPSCSLRYGA